MKLLATASHFEALSPEAWNAVKKQIQSAGRTWGINIAIDDDLTVRDAIARFWAAYRIYEDARLTSDKDG